MHNEAALGHKDCEGYHGHLEEEWEKCPANALGNTPLHMAAAEGDLETCKMINEVLPNNKNMKNRFGKTPADRARKNGHTEIVDLFNN